MKASKGLDSYKGKLDAEQIAAGMNAAMRNARRLFEDAVVLLEAKRFASTAALAILSIEESGKLKILRHLAMAPNTDVMRQAWGEYRRHRSKNTAWILPQLVAQGAKDLDSLREATDPSCEHTAVLDQLKQVAFYTDCLGEAHWSEPSEVIDEQLAKSLVNSAKVLLSTREVTSKEVELWTTFMKPVYGAPLKKMKIALEGWFEAMQECEIQDYDMKNVRDFVWGKDIER